MGLHCYSLAYLHKTAPSFTKLTQLLPLHPRTSTSQLAWERVSSPDAAVPSRHRSCSREAARKRHQSGLLLRRVYLNIQLEYALLSSEWKRQRNVCDWLSISGSEWWSLDSWGVNAKAITHWKRRIRVHQVEINVLSVTLYQASLNKRKYIYTHIKAKVISGTFNTQYNTQISVLIVLLLPP